MNFRILAEDALKFALIELQQEILLKSQEYVQKVDPTVKVEGLTYGRRFLGDGLKIKLDLVK